MPPRRDRDGGDADAPPPAPPAKPSPPARRRAAAAASPAPSVRQRSARGLSVDATASRGGSVGASSRGGGAAARPARDRAITPRAAAAPSSSTALGAPTWSNVDDAPVQARYDFVLTGYRYNYSAWHGLTGLFQWHFETVNIWTHLLGLLWFVAQIPRTVALMEASHSPKVDKLYYYGFLGAAMFQMATSTVYHTWRNMSPAVETALLRLDVVGVAGMIVGSYAVGLLNGFWCDPWLHVTYMAIIVAILGAGCGLMLIESFQDPRWMLARNLILALSVVFGLIPSVHWALVETCTRECLDTFAMALVKMFGFYGLGFLLFIYRIPERFAPGYFDYLGASHQWWHAAVWAAGSAWYEGMVRYYTWRTHSLECPDGVHKGDAHAYDPEGGWWPHLFTWMRAAYARHWQLPDADGGGL